MDTGRINGIRVVWEASPPPFRATLAFRAGVIHERLPEKGASEIIAHSALSRRRPRDADVGVEVAPESTTFFAVGDRAEALAVLEDLGRALSEPGLRSPGPRAGLPWALGGQALRRAVAEAPRAPDFEHPLDLLLHRLFGHTGVGRHAGAKPPLGRISEERLAAVARRCFHRDNAVITLTGPPPPTWDLTLPPGDFPPFPLAVETGHPASGWLQLPISMPALVIDVQHDRAGIAALGPLLARITHAVHQAGFDLPVIDPGVLAARDRLLMSYVVDCAPRDAGRAAACMVSGLRSFLHDPLDAPELRRSARDDRACAADPDQLRLRLDEAGAALLANFGPEVIRGDDTDEPTTAQVAHRIARAAATPLLLVPPVVTIGPEHGLAALTSWRPPPGPPLTDGILMRRPLLRRGPGPTGIVQTDIGLTCRWEGAPADTVHWSQIAGVERDAALRTIHVMDGRVIHLDATRLARPQRLLEAIDAQTAGLAWDAWDPAESLSVPGHARVFRSSTGGSARHHRRSAVP